MGYNVAKTLFRDRIMTKNTEKQLDIITVIINNFAQGCDIQTIEQACANANIKLTRRTLQRRLIQLKALQRIDILGKGRATLYKPNSAPPDLTEYGYHAKQTGIPLTKEAQKILKAVSLPIASRKPVQYHRDFFDQYHPNKTAYLSASTKAHLHTVGQRFKVNLAAGTYAHRILNRLLVDLSWASSHLEGNTYSLLETERLVVLGEPAPGKSSFETQMVLNHKAAIEFLVEDINEVTFDQGTILSLHALLSDNLLNNPKASGQLRSIPVGIAKSVYVPTAIPALIEEMFQKMLDITKAISDPFEQAFFITVHLPYLQPFEDVNKRVSRLAANIPLLRENLCPLSFMDVPEDLYIQGLLGVYELNAIELLRDVFVWTYERSCERYQVIQHTLGEPDPFRLRYREALIHCIGEAIRQVGSGKSDNPQIIIEQLSESLIPEADRKHFLAVAKQEIKALHKGNYARFKIRPSEFQAWESRRQSGLVPRKHSM